MLQRQEQPNQLCLEALLSLFGVILFPQKIYTSIQNAANEEKMPHKPRQLLDTVTLKNTNGTAKRLQTVISSRGVSTPFSLRPVVDIHRTHFTSVIYLPARTLHDVSIWLLRRGAAQRLGDYSRYRDPTRHTGGGG